MKDMTPAGIAGQSRNWMYRMGGIASFTIGAAYILIIVLYAIAGAPPSGAEERLNDLAGKTGIWWAIVGVSVFTNFLYVPVSISLYFGLKDVNQIAMLIGAAFINLFVVLENAVNWTVYGALIVLSEGYASAAAESQRAIFVAAASFANAVLESPLAAVWAIGAISVGFLIIGLVMRKSSFGRPAAYMGILTGILGIAVVAGVDMAVIPNAVTATIWLFLVGYRLYRLV